MSCPRSSFAHLAPLLLTLSLAACTEAERPNLILISLDTMRADRLSAYGRIERETTPVLDRLAAEAALFTDCLAPSTVTGPSHLSLFTGQYPTRHGLTENGARARPGYTLASLLAEAGYETAGFTGGGYLRESFGLAHGFETYRARGGPLARFKRTFETSLPHALQWLKQRDEERPFFLFLHGYDPHCPYEASEASLRPFARVVPAPFDPAGRCGESDYLPLLEEGRFGERELTHLEDLYDALVAGADRSLKPLVRYLRTSGLLERSILVFASDHGEGLGEHGWIGHGRLWDEQASVPLFVRFPGGRFAGRYDAPVSLVDVAPTLLEALGLPVPEGVQGESLMPLLRGERADLERPRLVVFGDEAAVRFDRRWKVTFRGREGEPSEVRVHDLAADPGEERDLAGTPEGRARFEEVFARFAAWRRSMAEGDRRHRAVEEAGELSEEERADLSALGYLER